MPNWEEIRKEWETTDISFKELAEKYDIKDSTIRSRKNREKWQRNGATQRKNVATEKRGETQPKKEVIEPVVESDEITDKQRLFAMYFVKYFNATKAYQKAYECDYMTAKANGSRLLTNANLSEYIQDIKKRMLNDKFLDAKDVLQKYIDIAFADITDFLEFGREEMTDDEGNSYEVNRVRFKESSEVDGTLITEVKQGKDGVSLKLADKMKALELLSKYTDLLSENDRKKLQEEKLKVDIAKVKSEIKGSSGGSINVVDFSSFSTEELRAIADSNKRTD